MTALPVSPTAPGSPPGAPIEHARASTVLIVGAISLVFPPLGPVAWVQGRRVLAEIDAAPGRFSNRSSARIGRTLGIVGTVLLVLAIAWLAIAVVYVAIAIADGTFDTD